MIANINEEDLRRGFPFNGKLHFPAIGIGKRITGNFRYGGGDPRLILLFKAQKIGYLSRPLSHENNVRLM